MTNPDPNAVENAIALVVDDDQGMLKLLTIVFRAAGFDVRVAEGGHEALELLTTVHPEVIISDVIMPKMSGYELCRRVRSSGLTDIPFVFCSALSDLPERIEGLSLGADDYVAKPIQPEELILKVRTLVQRGRRLRAVAELAKKRDDTTALRGRLEETAVPELLQLCDFIYRGDACLSLETSNGASGRIWTTEGTLLHADAGSLSGSKAFYRMLGWASGAFRIERIKFEGTPTLSAKINASLLTGLAYLDEYRRLRARLGGNGGAFVVSDSNEPCDPPLDANATLILGLVESHPNLDAALDHSPISDLDTIQALFTLIELGAILPSERSAP